MNKIIFSYWNTKSARYKDGYFVKNRKELSVELCILADFITGIVNVIYPHYLLHYFNTFSENEIRCANNHDTYKRVGDSIDLHSKYENGTINIKLIVLKEIIHNWNCATAENPDEIILTYGDILTWEIIDDVDDVEELPVGYEEISRATE